MLTDDDLEAIEERADFYSDPEFALCNREMRMLEDVTTLVAEVRRLKADAQHLADAVKALAKANDRLVGERLLTDPPSRLDDHEKQIQAHMRALEAHQDLLQVEQGRQTLYAPPAPPETLTLEKIAEAKRSLELPKLKVNHFADMYDKLFGDMWKQYENLMLSQRLFGQSMVEVCWDKGHVYFSNIAPPESFPASTRLGVVEDLVAAGYVSPADAGKLIKLPPGLSVGGFRCTEHDPVDTGMRVSWCKRCDCKLVFTADLKWVEGQD